MTIHKNHIFVSDWDNKQIKVFTMDGILLRSFDVEENSSYINIHNNQLFVYDITNKQIIKYRIE